MKLNEHTALQTPRLLLVPYSPHHVPTYHSWMQDEDLQTLTASTPLTLSEEYAMCTSWRTDVDKLTFIICLRAPTSAPTSFVPAPLQEDLVVVVPEEDDAPEKMIGDVNLFLYPFEDEEDQEEQGKSRDDIIGELEIMIAPPFARGKGYAKEALEAFTRYINDTTTALLEEYGGIDEGKRRLRYLRVKINKDNVKSLGLFEKMGFNRLAGGPNYFGEVEMRMGFVQKNDSKEKDEGRFKQVLYGMQSQS